MPTTDISEKGLETMIVNCLCNKQGYEQGTSNDYNKAYGVDCERVRRFILATQPKKAALLGCFTSKEAERKFFDQLSRELQVMGVSYVLRHGFHHITEIFDMYRPLPSPLNSTAQEDYKKNIFCVTRQLHYSQKKPDDSLDLMLSLNGLPVLTMELKNHYTGQTTENAMKQYKTDRDPNKDSSALLLQKKRCAVHFAVDDDDIRMCTELKGESSWFLPFNKGVDGGAGNPVNPNGLRTSWLWEEVLSKKSLSDILENYAQVIEKKKSIKDKNTGKKKEVKDEVVVWPRYHQLRCVRSLLQATREKGVGQHFLIQHSAGSGKSNSITWLAYQLVCLLDGTTPMLDSVIVVTDRVNLDNQIRQNIKAFGRLKNIVEPATSSSKLRDALQNGKKIIITTVQKFPYIVETIGGEMRDKRFGIIIDEAHSSQNGSLSAKMNIALSGNATNGEDDGGEDLEDKLNKIVEGRKMLENANYYAFTATPKNKTLEMFGTPIPNEKGETGHKPYDVYTMKQAIEEGFIMDVLRNYTTYDTSKELIKKIEEDPEFEEKQAKRKLNAFVERHPDTIRKKAEIMVDHFLTNVIGKGKLGGQARAMVVTNGIDCAIEYYYTISDLLNKQKCGYKAIVAFSRTKEYNGKEVSESDLNGFPTAEIEDNIGEDPYRILVVADKFQTGYDQPLLHTMYVDKMLTSVKAVQTLSRLNRCHPQKIDTFILDFVNSEDSIKEAFQPYYKTTMLSKETDPNKLNNLIRAIEKTEIYTDEDVEKVNKLYWGGAKREALDPIIDRTVERFIMLGEDEQIRCKGNIKSFLRTYSFIAAVSPYSSTEWEKKNTFYAFLVHKLPNLSDEDFTDGLLEIIKLDQLKVEKEKEIAIELENKDSEIDPIPIGESRNGPTEPQFENLSAILDEFNDIHWDNPDLAKKQLAELPAKLEQDKKFINAVKNSNKETAQQQFNTSMTDIIVKMLMENSEFCLQYIKNKEFQNFINDRVFNNVYHHLTNNQ